MKAIVLSEYGVPENLTIKETPKPFPKDNEVLVKIVAISVNDWDIGLITGKPFINRLLFGLRKPKVIIPGVDIAGKVEAIGKKVTKFQPGDEVFGDLSENGFGGFAEYVCANETVLTKKPPGMSFEDAAAIPHATMLTLQGLLDKGRIQSNQKLLINGAGGGVGTFGIQMARLYGAHVTGVDSADKLKMMESLGFERVINYKQNDFTKEKNQYDLILDVKTNRPIFKYARALKPNGRYVTVGGSMLRILEAVLLAPWFALMKKKYILVLGLKPNKDLIYVKELYEAKKLKPVIDGPYQFSDLPKAVQHFAKGEHKGKVIITSTD